MYRFGRGARFGSREIQIVFAEVADGGRLLVAVFEEGVVDLVAPVPKPDVAHADAIVRPQHAGVAQRAGKSGRAREVATGKFHSKYPTPAGIAPEAAQCSNEIRGGG